MSYLHKMLVPKVLATSSSRLLMSGSVDSRLAFTSAAGRKVQRQTCIWGWASNVAFIISLFESKVGQRLLPQISNHFCPALPASTFETQMLTRIYYLTSHSNPRFLPMTLESFFVMLQGVRTRQTCESDNLAR